MSPSPSREDPLARLATTWLGGPLGAYARLGRSWWTPVVVLFLVTTATFAIGVAQKAPCMSAGYAAQAHTPDFQWRQTERGWNPAVEGWDDRRASYLRLCYSDVAYLYRERGFADGNVAYLDAGNYPALEYPVLTGLVMQATAWVTGAFGNGYAIHDSTWFFGLTVLLLFGCALLTVYLMRRIVPDRPYDAMFVAAAPTLALSGVINWDLVAVVVTVAALFAWSRSRPVLAGILIGVGAATKLFPLLLLGPLLVLALRTHLRGGPAGRTGPGALAVWGSTAVAALVTWLGVNLPVLVLAPGSWGIFWSFNEARGADFGSIWLVLGLGQQGTSLVNALSLGCFVLSCVGIAALALFAPHRPRVAQLVFLTIAAFLLFNKVYSPQYVLWLLPLAALARPRWRDWAIWQAAEVLYWVAIWLYLAGLTAPADGGPDQFYTLAVALRFGATVYLCIQVIRDILAPERDVVRAGRFDFDPIGGVFSSGRSPAETSRPRHAYGRAADPESMQEVAR